MLPQILDSIQMRFILEQPLPLCCSTPVPGDLKGNTVCGATPGSGS